MRAGIYTRISDDGEGLGLGVARQEQDCSALCERQGWTVLGVYEDNDKSAFSGKPREDYERLLEDVKAGMLDVVVAWHPDRLHRSPKELERFIDVLEATGVQVATCTAGSWDLTTVSGRQVARILGACARAESEHKSVRIKRKHRQLADAGTYIGGSKRPFGHRWVVADGRRVGLEVDPDEARLVQEAARRVLAGESLYGVVGDWNSRGVPSVTGAPWSTKTLLQILVSGRVGGYREFRGELVGRSDQWDALLDEPTWKAVRTILLDPARRKTRVARSYLLGQGLLRCSECGSKLVAFPRYTTAGELVPRYGCRRERGGCGKVSAPALPVEKIVSEAVLKRLSSRDFLARLKGVDETSAATRLQADVAEMEASLEMLAQDFYVLKVITRSEFLSVRDRLVPRLDAARADLAKATRQRPSVLLEGLHDVRGRWEELGLDRRRALIELCLQEVVISPAVGRPPVDSFDPARLQAWVWRV